MKPKPKNVLLIRNDKLGDLLVTLPAICCLKQALPEAKFTALVPEYTKEVARLCPSIDATITDPGREQGILASWYLHRILKQQNFDAVVTFFSTSHTAIAVWLSGIPYRLAPATKFAQIAYNHRLKQRRSRSIKPEHEYNLDLAKRFLSDVGYTEMPEPRRPFLVIEANKREEARSYILGKSKRSIDTRFIYVHAGSGGSSNNLSVEKYAKLIKLLDAPDPYFFILSAGPGELESARRLSGLIEKVPHMVYESRKGLAHFVEVLSTAELFIGGSTGPLHIAGALDIPTAAFYVRLRTSSSLRWQTVNSLEKRLSFSPDPEFDEEDMSGVNLEYAARRIKQKFLA